MQPAFCLLCVNIALSALTDYSCYSTTRQEVLYGPECFHVSYVICKVCELHISTVGSERSPVYLSLLGANLDIFLLLADTRQHSKNEQQ